MNDADIEMAQLAEAGNRAATAKRHGVCFHGRVNAPNAGPAECLECGKQFPSKGHLEAECEELLVEWM
jgi:hypothetical protein